MQGVIDGHFLSRQPGKLARRTNRVKRKSQDLLRKMAPQVGLEPTTLRLTAVAARRRRRCAQKLGDVRRECDRSGDPARQATADSVDWRVPARLTAWLRSRRTLTWWPTSRCCFDDARDPVGETQ